MGHQREAECYTQSLPPPTPWRLQEGWEGQPRPAPPSRGQPARSSSVPLQRRGSQPHPGFLPPADHLMRSKRYRPSSDHSCFPRNAPQSLHSQIQTLPVLLPESSTLHTHILSQSFPHRLPLSEAFSGFPGPQGQRSILLGLRSAPSWSPRPSSPARREHSLSPNSLFTCLHTFALKSCA